MLVSVVNKTYKCSNSYRKSVMMLKAGSKTYIDHPSEYARHYTTKVNAAFRLFAHLESSGLHGSYLSMLGNAGRRSITHHYLQYRFLLLWFEWSV